MPRLLLTAVHMLLVGALGLSGCSREPEPAPPCGSFCDDLPDLGKADGVVQRVPWGLALELVGAPDVVTEGISDLGRIAAQAPGAALIGALEARAAASGERMVLRLRHEPDGEMTQCGRTLFLGGSFDHKLARVVDYHLDGSGQVQVDEAGPGVGPARIRLIVNRACRPAYADGTPCAEPFVWMYHEMIHALHALQGELLDAIGDASDPMQGGSNHEEARTIGRGAYLGLSLSENGLRSLIGLPLRDSHGSMCGPRAVPDGGSAPDTDPDAGADQDPTPDDGGADVVGIDATTADLTP